MKEKGPVRSQRLDRGPLLALDLDAAPGAGPPVPLHRQLYDALRRAILDRRLGAGARLPSSRARAAARGQWRNTLQAALDQLLSEGYVEGRSGSGTFVVPELPDRAPDGPAPAPPASAPAPAALSRRGAGLAGRSRFAHPPRPDAPELATAPFAPGLPELDGFPFDVWARLLARHWRHPAAGLALGGDPAGYPPLRAAIADHLRRVRAVDCSAEQVIVLSGIRQAVDLTVRLLLDPGDAAWMEEPGFAGIRAVLAAADLEVIPVPVDDQGLDVAAGMAAAPAARLAVVAPSHQYPLGLVMSLKRRLDLLAWAKAAGAWVIEDDYHSEYRYAGRPLAAMQGLDRDGRVIYVGTFSKVMFPGLRIGYLVAPPSLVEAFKAARGTLDDHAPMTPQPALADFIAEGHYAAHLRRMRRLYAARQLALLDAASRHLGGLLELAPDQAGMHLVAALSPALAARMDDTTAAARAAGAGVAVMALSRFYAGRPQRRGLHRQGLLLGYAAFDEAAIEAAAERLARALAA